MKTPAERWADHVGGSGRRGQSRVGRDERCLAHERRQVGHERRSEQHLECAQHDARAVQQFELLCVGSRGHRDEDQQQRSREIGADQQRAASLTIDPGAGDEADNDRWNGVGDTQDGHLPRCCLQRQGGAKRKCEGADLRADLGDGLTDQDPDQIPSGATEAWRDEKTWMLRGEARDHAECMATSRNPRLNAAWPRQT